VPENYNPARKIEKFAEDRRERFLTSEELERLGSSIRMAETQGIIWEPDNTDPKSKHLAKEENRRTVISPHAAAALRLLIFTGARLREILHLRWEHVDLERGLLLLPDSKTGRKTIVLNRPALDVLRAHPHVGAFVIASDKPDRPRADLKKPWALICRGAQIEGVRLHDLRHTFASIGAGASLGLPIVGKLLGHSQPQTTARYAHLDADPVRRASNIIGDHLESAMGQRDGLDPKTPLPPAP
jgi:integrase